MSSATTCSVKGCEKPVVAKGCCATHYRRLKRAAEGEGKATLADPLRRTGLVKLDNPPRVSPEALERLEKAAKAKGISVYMLVNEILEGWRGEG